MSGPKNLGLTKILALKNLCPKKISALKIAGQKMLGLRKMSGLKKILSQEKIWVYRTLVLKHLGPQKL